jgi:hypothetical protein
MAVLADGFSVIVRKEALERTFPGGLAAYQRQVPNETYCHDDQLCRVGFMTEGDAVAHARRLVAAGLTGPAEGPSPDVALVCSKAGVFGPCDRLDLRMVWLKSDGQSVSVMLARLPGDDATRFAAPAGWRPTPLNLISAADLEANYELVKVDRKDQGSVETYRHRQTGELVYVGRPDVVQAQARYQQLVNELAAIEDMSEPERRAAADACLARATQLVDDTRRGEAGPLVLQGYAARLAGRHDVEEQASRTVTTLQPEFLSGWHDLARALCSLGRLDEAEGTARHALSMAPDDPRSLGNLASVLRQRGSLDEAHAVAVRATELDPSNHINELILDQIRNDRRKRK